ncbi:MAG: arylesterase [Cryomorphaceae bacterium]|nr:MAG: arylesterase [Cryomorphaceae bacterium]
MMFFNRWIPILSASVLLACESPPSPRDTEPAAPTKMTQVDKDEKVILFFGNSLTAGYGLDPDESFPGILQHWFDSLEAPVRVINAGVTGETTATGKNRVEWVLSQQRIDVFVLELGGNDGLRGIPTEETARNLRDIIAVVRAKQPEAEIVLAGMMVPPNMGQEYSAAFEKIFSDVAASEQVALIPFLLEGVAGEAHLNLPDGIHPNREGQRIVAKTVWPYVAPLVQGNALSGEN